MEALGTIAAGMARGVQASSVVWVTGSGEDDGLFCAMQRAWIGQECAAAGSGDRADSRR